MNLADRLKQTTLRDLTRGGYKEQVRGYCRDGHQDQRPA
jgi:hypothetical protein